MLLKWWLQSLVSAVVSCFHWPVLRRFSTWYLSVLLLCLLLECLGCCCRCVEVGAVQKALAQGLFFALGRSQFQGVRSERRDTRVMVVRQRGRGDAVRVRGGPVCRCRVVRPPSKMADCRGGAGGGGGSSFGKRAGAADAATTGATYFYLYIS